MHTLQERWRFFFGCRKSVIVSMTRKSMTGVFDCLVWIGFRRWNSLLCEWYVNSLLEKMGDKKKELSLRNILWMTLYRCCRWLKRSRDHSVIVTSLVHWSSRRSVHNVTRDCLYRHACLHDAAMFTIELAHVHRQTDHVALENNMGITCIKHVMTNIRGLSMTESFTTTPYLLKHHIKRHTLTKPTWKAKIWSNGNSRKAWKQPVAHLSLDRVVWMFKKCLDIWTDWKLVVSYGVNFDCTHTVKLQSRFDFLAIQEKSLLTNRVACMWTSIKDVLSRCMLSIHHESFTCHPGI